MSGLKDETILKLNVICIFYNVKVVCIVRIIF